MAARATGRDGLYNIVSVFFLILSALVCCGVGYLAATSPGPQQAADGPTPTLFVPSTETPTLAFPTQGSTSVGQSTSVAEVTDTSATETPTPTATVDPNATPTETPTATEEGAVAPTSDPATPSSTPTIDLTNQASPTPTLTRTRAPFDYVLRSGSLTYTSNFANPLGCSWAGIAGTVFNLTGEHQPGMFIHITGNGLDTKVQSGSNTAYGTSGWDVKVADNVVNLVYQVRLESPSSVALSDVVTVQMVPECSQNLALIIFDQVQ